MKKIHVYAILAIVFGTLIVLAPVFIFWFGAPTFTFMQTEQMSVTSMTYPDNSTIRLAVKNTGTGKVTLAGASVNGNPVGSGDFSTTMTLNAWEAGESGYVEITYAWTAGNTYKVVLQSSTGTNVASYEKKAQLEDEAMQIYKFHTWVDGVSFAESTFLLVNTGGLDLVFEKVVMREEEIPWTSIWFSTTTATIIADLPYVTPANATTGALPPYVTINGTNHTLTQGTENLILQSGQSMIVYLSNPDNLSVGDIGMTVRIKVFTANAEYDKECNVAAVS